MSKARNKKESRRGGLWCLLLLLLVLAVTVLVRALNLSPSPAASAEPAAETAVPDETAPPEPSAAPTAEIPEETPEPTAEVIEEAQETMPQPQQELHKIRYTAESYQLVTDMVYAYSHQAPDRNTVIADRAEKLKQLDPALGEAWESIMHFWDYANDGMEINRGELPDGLPEDDSLCLVVLGFQLLYDGGMTPELQGRCELALAAAKKYPNAYLVVTGGGTAMNNEAVTEASVMAEWFEARGIAPERIIREDASMTTAQNAQFTLEILVKDYPQIKSLAIITSDYHVPLGSLMFTETALFYACEHGGEPPFTVVSNLGYATPGLPEYNDPIEQAKYVWSVADPHL